MLLGSVLLVKEVVFVLCKGTWGKQGKQGKQEKKEKREKKPKIDLHQTKNLDWVLRTPFLS